ncbi:TIGR04149 family rSAM-modified RiPP [Chryseobacterium sp. MA9]|uniref:TIGR04149 family rSAM-modified RiPP n=1 Tax=Chryseobacterium sp. MA9 TaxID=2966625 RepID=UPI002105079A|nr:TIGR04149 family rSAM-modified RiPP [Chryseobacterium sp. MA9]UTX48096.1 TIGR04149 family rSAM-modified RiPP [Chryseobacterium sp. MA9]
MKKINLKKLKGSLSRNELKTIKGGLRFESSVDDSSVDMGCGCTNAACANTHNGNGDSYCNGTFCCG